MVSCQLHFEPHWGVRTIHVMDCMFCSQCTISHLFRWFTYVASLSLLKTAHEDSQLLVSLLIVARMAPNTICSFPGGFLADCYNRKVLMVVIDLLSAVVALTYLAAVNRHYSWLLVCTILQETLSGLYEPSRSAILPLLLDGQEYLDKANITTNISWSLTAAIGSGLGGWVVAHYGAQACFFSDAVLYLLSAMFLHCGVHGNFNTSKLKENGQTKSSPSTFAMLIELLDYLHSPKGVYVLFKFCGSFLFGASDVLQVFFATDEEGHLDSERLGWLFVAVGIGCLVGPLSVPANRSYILTIICAYAVLGLGFGALGLSRSFWLDVLLNVPRSAGAALLWVESSILVQRETDATILGRVSAVDYSLALLGEGVSAVMAGYLQDSLGWNGYEVSMLLSSMGFAMSASWGLWYFQCYTKRTSQEAKLYISEDDVEMEPLNST